MKHKIGEIFEYNDEWYQCLENNSHCCGCDYCDFGELGDCDIIDCSSSERNDNKEVYFKKLEKVGEPITVKGRTFQKLISDNCSCANCVFNTPNKACYKNSYIDGPCPDNKIWVEIKQNKENMEKYKMYYAKKDISEFNKVVDECLSGEDKLKLKPFDIQKAREGKPVCTRDGRKARIIAFDANGSKPIVALVTECDNEEEIPYKYHYDGSYNCQSIPSDNDLMMLPEKKEGWIVIHKEAIYDKETAEKIARETTSNVIKIQKIEWEE